jgi:hypothetical protein
VPLYVYYYLHSTRKDGFDTKGLDSGTRIGVDFQDFEGLFKHFVLVFHHSVRHRLLNPAFPILYSPPSLLICLTVLLYLTLDLKLLILVQYHLYLLPKSIIDTINAVIAALPQIYLVRPTTFSSSETSSL